MVTIELKNGYFIEQDEMNATLKRDYVSKGNDGHKKPRTKVVGYYPSVKACLERFLELERLGKVDGMRISLQEYINALNEADTRSMEFLKTLEI